VRRSKAKATVRNGVPLFTPNANQHTKTLAVESADQNPSSAQTLVSKTASSSTFPVERLSLLVIPNLWIAQRVSRSRQASVTSSAETVIMELALFAGIKFQMDR
jgi:DNA-binding transcriptional MocR family regulator